MVLLQPPSASNRKPLYARSGWEIPCETAPAQDDRLVLVRAKTFLEKRGNLRLRSASGYPYNCVGLVFAARRAWIEIDYLYDILREDSYKRIQRQTCVPGDVIVYRHHDEPQHVGLIVAVEPIGTSHSLRVISKWGKDAEFEHFAEDVPESYGKVLEFYTDRR